VGVSLGVHAVLDQSVAEIVRVLVASAAHEQTTRWIFKGSRAAERRYIYIVDDVPEVSRARVFDPLKHSFNPLKAIRHRKAREIADILYTVSPQGENTLTVRNGKRALLKMLLEGPKALDKLPRDYSKTDVGPLEVFATVDDILVSPVLRRALGNPTNFSFNPNSKILARIDRAELGDFDSLFSASSSWRTSKVRLRLRMAASICAILISV
jgi:hypothetical protein